MKPATLRVTVTEWHLTISGPPRTKKTSNRLVSVGKKGKKRSVVLPSKAWETWCKTATIAPMVAAVMDNVSCRAVFYRDAERGDAVGYYQGLADLLEKRGVIVNDAQIRDWDGSRLLKDAANPRVEVTLRAALVAA